LCAIEGLNGKAKLTIKRAYVYENLGVANLLVETAHKAI